MPEKTTHLRAFASPATGLPTSRYVSREIAVMRDSSGRVIWSNDETGILMKNSSFRIRRDFSEWLQMIPESDREHVRHRHRLALIGQGSSDRYDLVLKDQSIIRVKSHMIPMRDGVYMELVLPDPSGDDPMGGHTNRNTPVGDKSRIHILSHEIRTPLTGILGFAQLIRDEIRHDTHLLEHIDWLVRSTEDLRRVMETWLEASGIEVGHIENHPRYTHIRELLQPMTDSFRTVADGKKLYLQVKWPKVDHVYVDPGILTSIMRELLGNALKFTESGGVRVSLKLSDQRLHIQVSDTGIGFETGLLPHLYEPYRQASDGLSRRYGGCGLGLSIVKGYVDHLQGEIRIESRVGEGTTVWVELPMHTITSDVNLNDLDRSKRILYVEDDPVIQLLCRRLLNDYMIDTCFTAEEALERIKSVRYDAVMVDVQLGKGMTGIQLCQALRKMDDYKDAPIGAVTAMSYDLVTDPISRLFDHYLPKPFDKQQLLEFVGQLTRTKAGTP